MLNKREQLLVALRANGERTVDIAFVLGVSRQRVLKMEKRIYELYKPSEVAELMKIEWRAKNKPKKYAAKN